MQHELVILSPEKTVLTYRLAGLGSRIIAHLLDLMILLFGIGAITFGIATQFGTNLMGLSLLFVQVLWVLGPFAYFILQEGLWNGQTLGKKAAGIRVRMVDGTPVKFAAAVGRNLLRPADMLPGTYFVGFAAIFMNPRSQRIGDLVASTIVVHEKRATPYYAPAPHTAGIHPLESYVGDLRGMTQAEYDALRRLCDRFPELPPNIQDQMIAEVWRPIATRRGVPDVTNVHPLYLAEATVMKYGRKHGLL